MKSKYEAILFDLDGTLFHTADDLGASLNFVLAQNGLPPVTQAEYTPVASDGAKGLLQLGFKSALKEYDYEALRAEFLAHYHANNCVETTLFGGISELLLKLSQDGIIWGVVTNKPEFLTTPLLAQFPEFKHSAVDVCGDTLAYSKPHPEPILYAAKQIDCDPKKCLYVGDALRDMQSGNDAGMTTAVAGWGYIKETDDVNSWDPDHICDDVDALLNLIYL